MLATHLLSFASSSHLALNVNCWLKCSTLSLTEQAIIGVPTIQWKRRWSVLLDASTMDGRVVASSLNVRRRSPSDRSVRYDNEEHTQHHRGHLCARLFRRSSSGTNDRFSSG